MEEITEYRISENILLKRKGDSIFVLKNDKPRLILDTYREVLEYMKDLLNAENFITKLSLMEKYGFFNDMDHQGLDREKIFQAIGYFLAWGKDTMYVEDSSAHIDNLNWFFKNIYFWTIDKDLILTLGEIIDYDPYEKKEYIKTYSEKFVDYLQRFYWVTTKYKDGKRYERPLFNLEGSVKLAMNKLKQVAKKIQGQQAIWKEKKNIIERNQKENSKKFNGYKIYADLILDGNWKDIYQVASRFKVEDLIDLNHLEYRLNQSKESSRFIENKVEKGISYWRLR